ncbi:gluconokinase [Arthrobacter sp. ISL-30]|uniref:gluconokinase n=1 Tax=Arthrobacter sp. ISL-30 TaxID=2819109 RepID=UPI001BECB600|nr:gluconokinase [Arthrobacter sp. ISL-30]MBT2512006.1 gluconokinase [Arthrobacter sp. ISL-30]
MKCPPTHLVVMGVAGAGKSTIAEELSHALHWVKAEADEFHPEANISKMSQGIPLQDEDRWPWLLQIRNWMTTQAQAGNSTVLTCSALKASYRSLLAEAEGRVAFLHLDGAAELLGQRMQNREGHFMPTTLLPSQLATLEPLSADELAGGSLRLDISRSPEQLVDDIISALQLTRAAQPLTPA